MLECIRFVPPLACVDYCVVHSTVESDLYYGVNKGKSAEKIRSHCEQNICTTKKKPPTETKPCVDSEEDFSFPKGKSSYSTSCEEFRSYEETHLTNLCEREMDSGFGYDFCPLTCGKLGLGKCSYLSINLI